MRLVRLSLSLRAMLAAGAAVAPVAALAQQAPPHELPLKYVGPPTRPEISAGDLMTRLYIFADDSMMGRNAGTEYNLKGTAYIEREVRRLGLQPAGDSGGYFQYLPVVSRAFDVSSTLTIDGIAFKGGTDFVASSSGRAPRQLAGLPVVYGGMQYDTAGVPSPEVSRGKILLLRPFVPPPGFNQGPFVASAAFRAAQQFIAAAAVVAVVGGDQLPAIAVNFAAHPADVTYLSNPEGSLALVVTTRVAEAMMGAPLAQVSKGATAKTVSSDVHFVDAPRPTRNVVAILPGSDAKLRGEYLAIGAHNDHVGFSQRPVDHDSLRAFMETVRPQGADSPNRPPTADEAARVHAMADSLHALHGARRDSIYNGADDDGSGSVSVLEIAEAFALGNVKPKRSLLFIWHVGEEKGLWGSFWFTDHPTVPRDSIVAELNMDMVGRGGAADVTGEDKEGNLLHGGPGYLQAVGSRRLSTELGDLAEAVNNDKKLGIHFDYSMDANGHPQNIYCRSDHWAYARYGIPIAFFTTGGHADYHQVTDEPEYIDYARMAQVDQFVFELALKVANLDHRLVVDKSKPADPKGNCVQ